MPTATLNEVIADKLIEEMLTRSLRPQYERDFRRESALGNMPIQIQRCDARMRLIARNQGSWEDYVQIELFRDYMRDLMRAA